MHLQQTTCYYASPRDPRRSFMVNGRAYSREANRKPEPAVSFEQAILTGIMIACFVVGVLCLAVAAS